MAEPPVKPITPLPTPMDLALQKALAKMIREQGRSNTGPGTYGPMPPKQNPHDDY